MIPIINITSNQIIPFVDEFWELYQDLIFSKTSFIIFQFLYVHRLP